MLAGEASVIDINGRPFADATTVFYSSRVGSGGNVLRMCRQIYKEAKPILYSQVRFIVVAEVWYYSSFKAVWYFLKEIVPFDSLKNIRYLEFSIEERIHNNVTTTIPCDDDIFKNLCSILANEMHLHHLTINVQNRVRYFSPHRNTIDRSTEAYHEVPEWVKQLLAIKRLDKLTLQWEYLDVSCLERTLKSARLMRTTMLKNGKDTKDKDCTVRLRHNEGQRARLRDRYLEFSMDLDKNGDSHLELKKRVKVMPNHWCRSCGRFPSSEHDICICGLPIGSKLITPGMEEEGPVAKHHRPWDSNDWGGQPLQAFLPDGVTEEDYFKAKALAEAGFRLQRSRWNQDMDSDYGDNDSLNSVHGWSDDEQDN